MSQTILAILTIEFGVLALSPLAFAHTARHPVKQATRLTASNSYPSPSLIRYAPERDPEDRRIDSFFRRLA